MESAPNQYPPPPPTQTKEERTLYNSSLFSIFIRNFLAGFARTLGGLILYVIFMAIIVQVFMTTVLPKFMPILETFQNLGNLANPQSGQSQTIDPGQLQNLLDQFKAR